MLYNQDKNGNIFDFIPGESINSFPKTIRVIADLAMEKGYKIICIVISYPEILIHLKEGSDPEFEAILKKNCFETYTIESYTVENPHYYYYRWIHHYSCKNCKSL